MKYITSNWQFYFKYLFWVSVYKVGDWEVVVFLLKLPKLCALQYLLIHHPIDHYYLTQK